MPIFWWHSQQLEEQILSTPFIPQSGSEQHITHTHWGAASTPMTHQPVSLGIICPTHYILQSPLQRAVTMWLSSNQCLWKKVICATARLVSGTGTLSMSPSSFLLPERWGTLAQSTCFMGHKLCTKDGMREDARCLELPYHLRLLMEGKKKIPVLLKPLVFLVFVILAELVHPI